WIRRMEELGYAVLGIENARPGANTPYLIFWIRSNASYVDITAWIACSRSFAHKAMMNKSGITRKNWILLLGWATDDVCDRDRLQISQTLCLLPEPFIANYTSSIHTNWVTLFVVTTDELLNDGIPFFKIEQDNWNPSFAFLFASGKNKNKKDNNNDMISDNVCFTMNTGTQRIEMSESALEDKVNRYTSDEERNRKQISRGGGWRGKRSRVGVWHLSGCALAVCGCWLLVVEFGFVGRGGGSALVLCGGGDYALMRGAANGYSMPLAGIGSVDTPSVAFSDVHYIPNLTMNLASVSKICDSGCDINFFVSDCCIYDRKTHGVILDVMALSFGSRPWVSFTFFGIHMSVRKARHS
ncbi:hypothetical protein Tco_0882419, partial [Tanacetum coccineum]